MQRVEFVRDFGGVERAIACRLRTWLDVREEIREHRLGRAADPEPLDELQVETAIDGFALSRTGGLVVSVAGIELQELAGPVAIAFGDFGFPALPRSRARARRTDR